MLTYRELDWRLRAVCAIEQVDPELFVPLSDDAPASQAQIAEAKGHCFRCPVAADCLDDALRVQDDFTIRGGMTATERRGLRSRRNALAEAAELPHVAALAA